MPGRETPRYILHRRPWEHPSMTATIGMTQVARPAHVEADLLALPFTEARRHDHVLRAEWYVLHELDEVFGEVWMDTVIVAEIEQPVTLRGDRADIPLEECVNRIARERPEWQMPPAVARMIIPHYHHFIESLSDHRRQDEFI